MNKYFVKFNGRENGAIGIFGTHTVVIIAPHEDAMRLKLYDTYEHVSNIKFRSVPVQT